MRRNKFRGKHLFSGKIIVMIVFFIISIILFFFFYFFKVNFLYVKSEGIDCVDKESIAKVAGIEGENIFFINLKKIEDNLKKKFICIKKISIQKQIPKKITLELFPRTPVFVLSTVYFESTSEGILTDLAQKEASSEPLPKYNISDDFLVDEEGVIFSKSYNSLGIQQITIFNINYKLGQNLEQDFVKKILYVFSKINNLGFKESKLYIDKHDLLFKTNTHKIILDLDRDLDVQIASLQLILKTAKIEEGNIGFIDLRFDKPVVKLWQKIK